MEREILAWWQAQGILTKYVRRNERSAQRWSFLDGPITANNPMGVHHAWGRTYKDLFQRYRTMRGFRQRYQKNVKTLAPSVYHLLIRNRWAGNVRELENLIERLAIFTATGQITAQEVERERTERAGAARGSENPASTLGGKLEEIERQEILRVLREAKGNKSLAARMLGIERKTLYEKARRLAIDLQSRPS